MAEYCSQTDVQNRLTTAGIVAVADRDRTGTASTAEKTAYIDTAVQDAGGMIDFAIVSQVTPASARAQTIGGACVFLRTIAVDLASYLAATKAGEAGTDSLKEAFDRARATLDNIRINRSTIPGLVYTVPSNGRSTTGIRVVNPR